MSKALITVTYGLTDFIDTVTVHSYQRTFPYSRIALLRTLHVQSRACVLIAPSNNKVEGSPDNITPNKGTPQKIGVANSGDAKVKKKQPSLSQRQESGFGLGFERMIIYATGMTNIRDVIPFPRTPRNCDF